VSEKPAKRKLTVKWSKRKRDFIINWPGHESDGHLINRVFGNHTIRFDPFVNHNIVEPSLIEELENRGYDTTTLRFEVSMREEL